MSENLKGLFVETDKDAVRNSARSLAGTAQLTATANEIANVVLKTVTENLGEYESLFTASKENHGAMDQLIDRAYDLTTVDVSFLKTLDNDTIEGMLKSQQSKRSRAKSAVMTLDNYRTMLIGAICEKILRVTFEKPKQAMNRRFSGSLEFTEAELAEFAADQNLLRKELRNIQSRKSIMKAKDGFSEEDPRWADLLRAEGKLKELRTPIAPDTTKTQLVTLLKGIDVASLKGTDAKALLEKAVGIVSPATEEVANG